MSFSSSDPDILTRTDGSLLFVQIHRPVKKNALTPGMYTALGEALRYADSDDSINVIVIRGTDDCFTSGNDVNSFVSGADEPGERPSLGFMKAISQAQKPVVAAVSGPAIGIGTTMLLHCDLVYASEQSHFQLPFSRLGVCPELGSSLLLPYFLGHQRAAELLLLGDRFSAETARAYGLINNVLPPEETLQFATDKARELASLPNHALQVSKRLMKRNLENVLPDTINLELKEFGKLLRTPEAQTIIEAFLNRKK
ncbi:MAG: enoyl-CoA hydratase [Gammaproteobacteria bacterium]|nr:enoyl-CoA hydratase [Pseudomonadales bacterium]MCP5345607.1 enoyl-CoA hydratase [Pseudomonadales bacterium]